MFDKKIFTQTKVCYIIKLGDEMKRIIMHIDVNNAFLSWSAIDLLNKGSKYDIRNSYAVIGGDERKRSGIVLAKSMACKKLGIKTADTLYSAKQKCPALRVFPPNFLFYKEMSNKMFSLLLKYSPDIEVASIDECYLDYGKVEKLYGDPLLFAKKIQKQIFEELGFTVNIGIANNKLCAKMASDFSKPYKIHTLYEEEVEKKLYPLPIEQLYGCGKKTSEKLRKLGIMTIGDLAHFDVERLKPIFKNMAVSLVESARGVNRDPVCSEAWVPKGIGNEITLPKDVQDKKELLLYLQEITENVALRLRKQKKYAYTVCVTLKTKDFKRKSHQKTLVNATDGTEELYKTVREVFLEMQMEEGVRLIGVRLDHLTDYRTIQGTLFDTFEQIDDHSKLDEVVDAIKRKYGARVIKKASTIEKVQFKNLKD